MLENLCQQRAKVNWIHWDARSSGSLFLRGCFKKPRYRRRLRSKIGGLLRERYMYSEMIRLMDGKSSLKIQVDFKIKKQYISI